MRVISADPKGVYGVVPQSLPVSSPISDDEAAYEAASQDSIVA